MFDGGDLGLWSKSEQRWQRCLHCGIDDTAGFRFQHVRSHHYFSYCRVDFEHCGNHFDNNCGFRAGQRR